MKKANTSRKADVDWVRHFRRWPEMVGFLFFVALSVVGLVLPLVNRSFVSNEYAPSLNAALSIGTGGVVSFVFYYLVNDRAEAHRRRLLQHSVRTAYRDAKWNIALAIVHASQKGGRVDLASNLDAIDQLMNAAVFRALFETGRDSDEGFYAFRNQMHDRTPEFEEIVFNLNVIARAIDRLIDHGAVEDQKSYDFFVRMGATIDRIEKSGPGYDESKLLCSFLWQMFTGWNWAEGYIGHDPIERAISRL